jgi:2'-5' RNA ligase
MHEEFNRRLAPLGFAAERREFSAHLTLARVKDAPRAFGKSLRVALDAVRPQPARWRVDRATVFESRLSPSGAVYQALFDVPFVT